MEFVLGDGNKITISENIEENKLNTEEDIFLVIKDSLMPENGNKSVLKRLIENLNKIGYELSKFQIGMTEYVGNYSFKTLINRYIKDKSIITYLELLGLNINKLNILLKTSKDREHVIYNITDDENSELKFVISINPNDTESHIRENLLNIIKFMAAYKFISNDSQESKEFADAIFKVYELVSKKYAKDSYISDILTKIKSRSRNSKTKICLEFLLYCYGNMKFFDKLSSELEQQLSKTISDYVKIDKTPNRISTGKLFELFKESNSENTISKEIAKSKGIETEEDILKLVEDFNFSPETKGIFIRLLPSPGKYYRFAITGKRPPLRDQALMVIGSKYYGPSTKLVKTIHGYNIVRTSYNRFIVDDHILTQSLDKILEKSKTFKDLDAAEKYILSQMKIELITQTNRTSKDFGKLKIHGGYIKPWAWWHKFLYALLKSGQERIKINDIIENPQEFFRDGDLLRFYDTSSYEFKHTIEQLAKSLKSGLQQQYISFEELTTAIGGYLKEKLNLITDAANVRKNFFVDDALYERYLSEINDYEKLELFYIIAQDILMSENTNDFKNKSLFSVNKNGEFIISGETRRRIIENTLNIIKEFKSSVYKIATEEDVDNNSNLYYLSKLEKIEPYTLPELNLKKDLIAISDHLKKHFGVQCVIINNNDISNGLLLDNKTVIKFPKKTQEAKAFIYNGVIYINIDKASSDDVLHEYAHLYLGVLKATKPKLYETLINEITKYPDFKKKLEYLKTKDTRPELDIIEEMFVTEFGRYVGYKLSLGYYSSDNFNNIISNLNVNKELKEAIIKTFGLEDSETVQNELILFLSNMTLEQVFDTFGSIIMENNESPSEERLATSQSLRKVSNYISKLIESQKRYEKDESKEQDKPRIKENCK